MPKLVCTNCGRQIYTVAPLRALFAEERCCARCGADLIADRRSGAADTRSLTDSVPGGFPQDMPERRSAVRR